MSQEETLGYLQKLAATLDTMQRQMSSIRSELMLEIAKLRQNQKAEEPKSDDDEYSLRMEGSRFF